MLPLGGPPRSPSHSSWRRGFYKEVSPAAEAIVTTLKSAGNGAIASRHPYMDDGFFPANFISLHERRVQIGFIV